MINMQIKLLESQKCMQNSKVTPQAKNSHKHESIACRISYNAYNDRYPQHFGTGLIPTGFIIKSAICHTRNLCCKCVDLIDHLRRQWC